MWSKCLFFLRAVIGPLKFAHCHHVAHKISSLNQAMVTQSDFYDTSELIPIYRRNTAFPESVTVLSA